MTFLELSYSLQGIIDVHYIPDKWIFRWRFMFLAGPALNQCREVCGLLLSKYANIEEFQQDATLDRLLETMRMHFYPGDVGDKMHVLYSRVSLPRPLLRFDLPREFAKFVKQATNLRFILSLGDEFHRAF